MENLSKNGNYAKQKRQTIVLIGSIFPLKPVIFHSPSIDRSVCMHTFRSVYFYRRDNFVSSSNKCACCFRRLGYRFSWCLCYANPFSSVDFFALICPSFVWCKVLKGKIHSLSY